MAADRQSTFPSPRGGQKSPSGTLSNNFTTAQTAAYDGARTRQDDSASYFDPEEGATAGTDRPSKPSAGYNRMSFLHTGREEPLKGGDEEEGGQKSWDVFADFNNTGPRYSTAFAQNPAGSYQRIEHPTPKIDDAASDAGPVEMVTVPAMGPEWKASELREMTKAGKRERKTEARNAMWKSWYRDERGFCGNWLTRKTLVFLLFGLCVVVGIVLAFTIPRVPSFAFIANTPLSSANDSFGHSIPVVFSRFPANFTFPAYAELQLNTESTYLPLTFNHLRAAVFDLDTGRQVAEGDLGKKTVPAKGFPFIRLPLNFTYVASNDTDQTWKNWYDSCKNRLLYPSGSRPPLKFRFVLESDIRGLPGSQGASTQVTNAPCPIELPANSV